MSEAPQPERAREELGAILLDTTKLREVVDGWGNPIVYFRNDSYRPRQAVLMGGDSEGLQEEVAALKDPTTNKNLSPRKYQLISAGPDLTYGTEDDITYPTKPVVD